jgi:hypothetical protein
MERQPGTIQHAPFGTPMSPAIYTGFCHLSDRLFYRLLLENVNTRVIFNIFLILINVFIF